jgi:glutamate-1-semialdehyde 2,1-aminomutase
VIHLSPFPLALASGKDSYLTDYDGHKYLDLCGEYSAGMFGHSNPIITKAMHEAIDNGYALGGVNAFEGRLANLFTSRFESIEKIRFSNSGTECVMTALSLIRAYTEKPTVLVMGGGYHGGLASFGGVIAAGMNAPGSFVITPYNDIEAMEKAVDANKDNLAAIVLELMQGSSGCIPADLEFVKACRRKATEVGAVLMFDEVMTSRMTTGGMQKMLGIVPEMTTLGKYFAGGGQNFGAFGKLLFNILFAPMKFDSLADPTRTGGKAEIMDLLTPGHPKGLYHSGTYNNNITTLSAACAVLEQVWTPEEASKLFALGDWFSGELNRVSKEAGSSLVISGVGSIVAVHFTGKPIRNAADTLAGNMNLRELFVFDMFAKGFFLSYRAMISLMTTHTKEELQNFIDAVKEWLIERKEFVSI